MAVPPAGARILLVEDAPNARELAVRMLSSLGYKVTAASNAVEALECMRRGERFDILFTDIIMPGVMDGIALAHAIRQIDPMIHVLFTSGFSQMRPEDITSLDAVYVAKPYRKVEIAQVLRDIV